MNLQFRPSLGYLATTETAKGLGVFAARAIDSGEIIEIAPVIELRSEFEQIEINLRRRLFDWGRLASREGVSALALGYGSMYNHANPANMRYVPEFDGGAIKFIAARSIRAGEELTINYNGSEPFSTEDIWFTMCNVIPIPDDGKD
jgi:SET domain-containing protein